MTARFKGFTLVELLIVIAIIGVLAVVVLVAINPVEQLAKTRDSGRISTVTQVGHALQAYYTSHATQTNAWPGELTWSDDLTVSGELSTFPSGIGYPASFTVCAENDEPDGGTNIPTYCYDSNEPGKFIIDGTVSTTDRYTVQTVTGKTIKCMAVNQSSLSTSGANGYYGDWNEIDMKTEKEDLDLSLHKTARPDQLRVSIFNKDGTTSTQSNLTINFSIGADSSYSLNKIRLRQDTANLEWWAGGVTIAMNDSVRGVSTAATNIKNVDWNAGGFTGNIIEGGALLDRLKSRSDFRFEFDADSATTDYEPIKLSEFDEVDFGSMTFEADADGCDSGDNETVSLIFWDKNYFRSAKSTAVLGPSGESDASTPLNVGSNDFEIIAMCGFNNNN